VAARIRRQVNEETGTGGSPDIVRLRELLKDAIESSINSSVWREQVLRLLAGILVRRSNSIPAVIELATLFREINISPDGRVHHHTVPSVLVEGKSPTRNTHDGPVGWAVARWEQTDVDSTIPRARDVSRALGVSAGHLTFRLRCETGLGWIQWRKGAMLRNALLLLGRVDCPIHRVASGAGWSSQERFCRQFREMTGGTASAFRRRLRRLG